MSGGQDEARKLLPEQAIVGLATRPFCGILPPVPDCFRALTRSFGSFSQCTGSLQRLPSQVLVDVHCQRSGGLRSALARFANVTNSIQTLDLAPAKSDQQMHGIRSFHPTSLAQSHVQHQTSRPFPFSPSPSPNESLRFNPRPGHPHYCTVLTATQPALV